MMRTSTGIALSAPTRSTSDVSRTRRSLTCSSTGISVISSRNSVPVWRALEVPLVHARSAPVKLPRSWPNSSLSITVGEMAPQSTGMNGFLLRRLRAWIVCATTPCPVPVSPVRRMLASVRATRPIRSYTFCMGGEAPMSAPNRPIRRSSVRSAPISPFISRVRVTLAEHHLEAGEVHGLGQVVGGAAAQGVHRGLDARLSRDQDDFGAAGPWSSRRSRPAAVGQMDVDEDDVGYGGRDLPRAWRQGGGRRSPRTPRARPARSGRRRSPVVVDDKGPAA